MRARLLVLVIFAFSTAAIPLLDRAAGRQAEGPFVMQKKKCHRSTFCPDKNYCPDGYYCDGQSSSGGCDSTLDDPADCTYFTNVDCSWERDCLTDEFTQTPAVECSETTVTCFNF